MGNEILKSVDLKSTKKRQLVLSILESSHQPMTAEEIHSAAIKSMDMSPSTVYRALNALTTKGILIKNISQDGLTYYQLKGHTHCHQLLCTYCNQVIPIDSCPLETLEKTLTEQTGYKITGHNLEFSGICPQCLENSEKQSTKQ